MGSWPGLDAWIDPPAYTGACAHLSVTDARPTITVPAGSRLNVRVHGADYTPILNISPSPQRRRRGAKGKDGEYASDAVVTENSSVRVRASGRTIGSWNLRAVPDAPPTIAFAGKVDKTQCLALKIPFRAKDDYGVTSVHLSIKPRGRPGKTSSVEIPLGAQSAKTINQTVYRDLTEHPYAGLDVALTLEARDGAGQLARSATVNIKLPARIFTNPLARALVEQRQDLAADSKSAPKVLMVLDALTIAPELFYADKKNIYTALRAAFMHAEACEDGRRLSARRGSALADRADARTGRTC